MPTSITSRPCCSACDEGRVERRDGDFEHGPVAGACVLTGMEVVIALAIGAAVGFVVGLLGSGGSVVTVPALMLLLGLTATQATGTSLVVVALISAIGVLAHARARRVDWRAGAVFAGFGVPASLGGGYVSLLLSDAVLTWLLVALLAAIAVWMWRRRAVGEEPGHASLRAMSVAGAGVGFLTGTLGVGGGFVVVPALTGLLGMPIAMAVGTSQLVLVVNAVAGLMGRIGTGVVDLPLGLVFAFGGALGMLVAARYMGRFSSGVLTKLFAGMLALVAIALVVDVVA